MFHKHPYLFPFSMASQPSSSFLARWPLRSYFVLAYGLSWLLWSPLVLSKGAGIGILPFVLSGSLSDSMVILIISVGSFGPLLAALIVSAAVGGCAEVGKLLHHMVRVRVGIQWYLLAVFVPLLTVILPAPFLGDSTLLPSLLSGKAVIALLIYVLATLLGMVLGSPIGEEPGWRGFALPRLQRSYGPLMGSLLLGVLWAFWHFPLFFTIWGKGYALVGLTLGILLFALTVIGYSVFMTWLYNNTRNSIFLAILFHSAVDSKISFFLLLTPHFRLDVTSAEASTLLTDLLAGVVVWAIGAALVIVLTKGRLSYKPALVEKV